LITAFFNCSSLAKKESINLIFLSPFLGIIHGLGFSNYFKAILGGKPIKVIAFGRICCGIEAAQIIAVLVVLIISTLYKTVLGSLKGLTRNSVYNRVVLLMIIENEIWTR
jgi:hypothetical protein